MAGPAPNTRNWTARENKQPPKSLVLRVGGSVEVSSTNKVPKLTESAERNPKHLGLTLTIEDTGEPGNDVMCWKPAGFSKNVASADQYDGVTIRWDSGAIAEIPVVDDSEHHEKVAGHMAALNAKHAKSGAKAAPKAPKGPRPAAVKPAKEAAAKKPAPKKAAPKKAKKAPAKKKAAKKAPKKAVAASVVRTVGGWAKGARKALSRAMGAKKAPKKAAKKAAKKAKKKR
jgi:hypothetical protein